MKLTQLFRKKKPLCWEAMTVRQYMKIDEVLKTEGDELTKSVEFLKILTGKDYSLVPLPEYMEKVKELSFLQEDMPVIDTPDSVTINGHKYLVKVKPDDITTAQFMDYMTHTKNGGPELLAKICTVFLVPDGHVYGDGYDFLEVLEDAYDMPFTTANAIAFFLPKLSEKLWKRSRFFLLCQIMALPNKSRKEKMQLLKDTSTLLQTMEYFRM